MQTDRTADLNQALAIPLLVQYARTEGIRTLERHARLVHAERLRQAFDVLDEAVCLTFLDTPATLRPDRPRSPRAWMEAHRG